MNILIKSPLLASPQSLIFLSVKMNWGKRTLRFFSRWSRCFKSFPHQLPFLSLSSFAQPKLGQTRKFASISFLAPLASPLGPCVKTGWGEGSSFFLCQIEGCQDVTSSIFLPPQLANKMVDLSTRMARWQAPSGRFVKRGNLAKKTALS